MKGDGSKSTPTKKSNPNAAPASPANPKITTVKKSSGKVGCLAMHFGLWTMVLIAIALNGYIILKANPLDWVVLRLSMDGWKVDIASIAFCIFWTWFTHKLYLYSVSLSQGGFNNENPRATSGDLNATSLTTRLHNAHLNMQEAFAVFAVPVVVGMVVDTDSSMRAKLCLVFVAARILYQFLYAMNLATLRSLVWTISWMTCLFLAVIPALPRGTTPRHLFNRLMFLCGIWVDL